MVQYGFLFGGGRSGVQGIRALQGRIAPASLQQQPRLAAVRIRPGLAPATAGQKLAPLTIQPSSAQGGGSVVFNRFVAVP